VLRGWSSRASCATPLRMHIVFFSLKRAYYGALRVTRRVLARLGLTSARFDLLYIVYKVGRAGSIMSQRRLQRELGVAAPTVSRMLASLEELALVEREVMAEDRRCHRVRLTREGRQRVLRAARLLIHSGHVQLAVDSALCPQRWPSKLAGDIAGGLLDTTLRRLRHAYGDVATLGYPWADPIDWRPFEQLRFDPPPGSL
jgi:DNA-binding MarR family transcriptional regulator